ncbi:MAG: IS200/IS605 family transposase [Flavobacteriales bacterium]|nr:IS200/IS605 family transposase [Flavobacteriales bacterium]
MANSYTQIVLHLVFAVKFRRSLINEDIRVSVEKYMTGIITNRGHLVYAIYCMPDHCHILISMRPHENLSKLVQEVKRSSALMINQNNLAREWFRWQSGYGAFSLRKSSRDIVIRYIQNQPERHKRKSFKKEYKSILKENEVEFDENYLFHEPD